MVHTTCSIFPHTLTCLQPLDCLQSEAHQQTRGSLMSRTYSAEYTEKKKQDLHNTESCFFCPATEPGGRELGLGWRAPGHQCPRFLHLTAPPFTAFWLTICISVRRLWNTFTDKNHCKEGRKGGWAYSGSVWGYSLSSQGQVVTLCLI